MALKSVFAAVCCAAILAAGSSWADEYRPDEFLTLDLSKAALSPKPLGPPAQFEPMRDEAKTDPQSNAARVDAAPKAVRTKIVHARAEKPRAPARTKVAAPPQQSARRAGVRYADSGLAVPVRRHLQLAAVSDAAIARS